MKASFKTLAFGFALAIGTLGFFNDAQAGIEPTAEACKGTNSNCATGSYGPFTLIIFKDASEPSLKFEMKVGK